MFKKILVPLDGSHRAEWAMKPALHLAAQMGAEVILLRVMARVERRLLALPGLDRFGAKEDMELYRRQCHNYLKAVRQAHYLSDVTVPLQPLIVEGDPPDVIVDTAVAEDVDLIVMTTHGRSAFMRWAMGSVTEKVLATARQPVWMVRGEKLPARILIALDGSTLSELSLPPAMAIAQALLAQVTLVCVAPPLDLDAETVAALTELNKWMPETWQHDMEEAAEKYVQQLASQQPAELGVKTAVLVGDPADCIITYAEKNEINLISMTTHGSSGSRRWAYGSTTKKVLDHARRDMLVVRSSLT